MVRFSAVFSVLMSDMPGIFLPLFSVDNRASEFGI